MSAYILPSSGEDVQSLSQGKMHLHKAKHVHIADLMPIAGGTYGAFRWSGRSGACVPGKLKIIPIKAGPQNDSLQAVMTTVQVTHLGGGEGNSRTVSPPSMHRNSVPGKCRLLSHDVR